MRLLAIISLLAALCSLAAGAAEPRITVLDNGLTVITQEMHYAPVIASVISYRVGSRNESGDILGISHFCEHLMFKGTPDMPKSRFWQIVQRDGGMANAFTTNDFTCYFLLLPASRIQDALAIESDRMVNCSIDSAEVISERNVVHEERRMSCIDSPDGALQEALNRTAYSTHPYMNPVIGYDDNILGYDWRKARNYYETYYCPSNAVLTIVGDFQTQELLDSIEVYFGHIPSGSVPAENIPAEPEQTSPRNVEIQHASNLTRFAMAFHSTSGTDPDNPAMEMIGTYLEGGRSNVLDQLLVQSGLVHDVSVWNDGGVDPGLFNIYVTMNPPEESDITVAQVEDMIWEQLDSLRTRGIPADELQQYVNRYRASQILRNASPMGLAMSYGISATLFGDPLYADQQLEKIETLTPDDIRSAAERVFRRDGVTVAELDPSGEQGMGGSGERQDLPTDITEPSSIDYQGLEIPDDFLTPPEHSLYENVTRRELPNGMLLLVKEDHSFPVVSMSFAVPIGALRYPSALNGLAAVTDETMMHGTDELDYAAFHRRLEMEGASLRFYSGMEYSTGSVTLLSEDLEIGMETISDLLRRPAFRESDFNTVMNEKYADLDASAERAFSVASDSLAKIMAASPDDYRNVSTRSLDAIRYQDMLDLYDSCCRPDGSVLAIVGDVDPDRVLSMVDQYFGTWENPDDPLPPARIPELSRAAGDTVVTFMPGRVQAAVMVGRNAPGYDMPDYAAFNIMNTILGRGIGSRLGHSVRDDQGLAYAVGSWVMTLDSTGVFTAFLSTLSDYVPQATSSVIAELDRIASEDVQDIELRLAKANAVGRSAFS